MVMVYDDGNMALIVTKDQNVYSFYFDKDDLLKKSGESHIGFYPKKIEELCGETIKTFACNSHIVMALTEEGKVFFWRFKEQNSFKMEEEMKVVKLETYYKYMGKKRIVDITCSNNHFLALTSDGDVYAWGNNHYGQIGTEKQPSVLKYTHRGYKINKYNFNYPRKVKRLRETKIASLACGSKFSMAISDEGKLFSWGRRYNENCKNDQWKIMRSYKGETYDPHPFKIIINKTIVKVACGFEHTLVLSNEGKIFGWGKNNKGQIGDPRCLFYYSPVTVKMPELVSDIAAYGNLSVAVSTNKTIYIWGECFGQQITVPVPTGFSTLHDAFAYTPTRVMHKPLIVSDNKDELPSPSESFGIDYLSSLFNYPEFGFNDPLVSDFIVCVGDQGCIYVNSYILSNRCQYFKNMFQHDQTKNNRSVRSKPERYIVSDFSYVIYKAFFKYLYTGKVDLPSETVLDLMKLADKYSETNLKEDCVLIIKSSITTSNVAFFYGRAIEYNIREVEEFCFQFASFHMKVVVQSNNYKQLDASIKDTFIQRAAEANLFKTKLFKTKLFLQEESYFLNHVAIMWNMLETSSSKNSSENFSDCSSSYGFLSSNKLRMNSSSSDNPVYSLVDNPSIQEKEKDEDMQEEISESSRTNKIMKNWPILNLLKPKFTMQIRMVMVYDNGNRALIVTKDKNVYTFECSKYDLWNSKDTHDLYSKKMEQMCGKDIKTFVCSPYVASALTEDGKLFFWSFKRHCSWTVLKIKRIPKEYNNVRNKCIVDIACSSEHFLALTNDGQLYAWGNTYGQWHQKSSKYYIHEYSNPFIFPCNVKHILKEKKVSSIACGSKFSVVLTDEGELYGWGKLCDWCDENNRSIIINSGAVWRFDINPLKIMINKTIVKIACGSEHVLALTNEGHVYAWGKNDKGQLGADYDLAFHYAPILVRMSTLVEDIAVYDNFNVAVDITKSVLWGDYRGDNYFSPFHTEFSTIDEALSSITMKVMHKPLVVSDSEELLNTVESSGVNQATTFDDSATYDFIVKVEGQRIHLHRYILKDSCQYFRHMFKQEWIDKNISLEDMPIDIYCVYDFSYIVYKAFFTYLYTGTVDVPSENALDLMKLADKYCVPQLKIKCHELIKRAITASNVALFYSKAIECNFKEVEEFCFQFALCDIKMVVLSDEYKKLDASIKDTFIQRATAENIFKCPSHCYHLKIRFAPRLEDEDMQEERSETKNEKEEMQKYKRRKLSCDLMNKIYPSSFRNWPILSHLKPEFIIQIRMIMVYGNGGNRTLIVTNDKNVYTLDYNKNDYLKINDTHIGLYPKEVTELCGKKIRTFTCNSAFVLALTEEGEVYSWKFNEFESDARSQIPIMQPTPTRVVFKKCIVDIACGSYHSLALTSDGQVYAWGDNSYGQVGIHKSNAYSSGYNQMSHKVDVPNLISGLKEKNVVSIACGSKFNMVVTGEGELYGWGDNKSGQINYKFVMNGSNLYKYYAHPFEIAVNDKVIAKVACGFEHTLALTDEGKVYAWGNNNKGQIGVHNALSISVLTMVDIPELVLDIGASANFSVAVGTNKTVYVWGNCFDQKITTPFLTGLSIIHDAFAHGTRVMHKPLAVSDCDVEEVLNLLESLGLSLNVLGMAFNDSSTSDCIIQVEEQRIYVHKVILQIRCQHFKNKFQHDWTENNDSKLNSSVYVVSEKFSYIVYKAFLKFLYTGMIDLPSENALELMILADEYGETSLKKKCNQIVEQIITPSNVAFFYSKAIEYKAKEFEKFCFEFALCHMKDVVLSKNYLKLDINIRNNFIQKAAKENIFRT
ncbi:LOW QUALITY PROTEIN: uncharacterized protein LOC114939022 [Nylanderia fulva]|uniref:LOW QUALITY PROTEIN: uncharacterized protein LOC114939022 n=1 Tax=Nylanderia fulva TaxID=613905 RepID=UPI0010FB363F|nr:LOW QUALITY PROTEIN: uncharacterized protein LOC114939022 [Nylanderia fulva]